MFWTARPLASTAWKYSGFFDGARKYADPSFSTGTVPKSIRALGPNANEWQMGGLLWLSVRDFGRS